jgi:hypothetical protein
MSSTGNLAGVHGAQVVATNNRSPWKLVVVTTLAIVLIACALGRATFQSGSSAWTPLGAVEGSFGGQ